MDSFDVCINFWKLRTFNGATEIWDFGKKYIYLEDKQK